MKDASRSVPTVASLLSDERRPALLESVAADYASLRERHGAKRTDRPLRSYAAGEGARDPGRLDRPTDPLRPRMLLQQARDLHTSEEPTGSHAVASFTRTFDDYDLDELREYIDWSPFFGAWEMRGRFPDLLHNPATATVARKLYEDAQRMLDRLTPGEVAAGGGHVRAVPGQPRRAATTSRSTPTSRGRSSARRCTTCASRASTARASRTARSPTSSRRRRAAWPTTSGRSR